MGPVHLKTQGGSEVVKVLAFDRCRGSALVIFHDPRCGAADGYAAEQVAAHDLYPVARHKTAEEVLMMLAVVVIGEDTELRRVAG